MFGPSSGVFLYRIHNMYEINLCLTKYTCNIGFKQSCLLAHVPVWSRIECVCFILEYTCMMYLYFSNVVRYSLFIVKTIYSLLSCVILLMLCIVCIWPKLVGLSLYLCKVYYSCYSKYAHCLNR